MKLFQYHGMSNDIRVGAVTEAGHVALPSSIKMEGLLGLGDTAIKDILAKEVTVPLKQENIRFAPVVTRPEKILCIGLNYDEHINETNLIHLRTFFFSSFLRYSTTSSLNSLK